MKAKRLDREISAADESSPAETSGPITKRPNSGRNFSAVATLDDQDEDVVVQVEGDGDGDGGEGLGESEAGAVRKGAEKETESMVRKLRNASGHVEEEQERGLWGFIWSR